MHMLQPMDTRGKLINGPGFPEPGPSATLTQTWPPTIGEGGIVAPIYHVLSLPRCQDEAIIKHTPGKVQCQLSPGDRLVALFGCLVRGSQSFVSCHHKGGLEGWGFREGRGLGGV